jgi:hypothetical protein
MSEYIVLKKFKLSIGSARWLVPFSYQPIEYNKDHLGNIPELINDTKVIKTEQDE